MDVRCLTNDGSDWAERERMRFNTRVEIFFNPPEKILAYFKEDKSTNKARCISAWDQGILFYDINGTGLKLKNIAKQIFKTGPHKGQ